MQSLNVIPVPPCQDNEYREVAWGKETNEEKHKPMWINRPKVGDFDVKFEMMYCGVCHSDCHLGNNDMGSSIYPIVTGHELVGTVVEVGSKVTKVKVGENVGVGCIIDSCLDCGNCNNGDENYCENGGSTHTYCSMKRKDRSHLGGNQDAPNYGGYSGSQVVHEHFAIKIPDNLPLDTVGPIMCAGITMYSPLVHWGATQPGKKMTIGVIGIGGLGTMGLKMAKAMGHRVVAVSSSDKKKELAIQKGADAYVNSNDPESMKAEAGQIDLLLNTVSVNHQLTPYLNLVRCSGTLVQLGLVTNDHQVQQLPLMFARKSIAGSLIGGIKDTEGCLEFCSKNNILPDVKHILAKEIDFAWDQLLQNSADGIRFVIDIKKSLEDKDFLPQSE